MENKLDRIRKMTNWRVVVMPFVPYTRDTNRQDAEVLAQEIKRHCDIEDLSIEFDMVCKFCDEPLKTGLDENGIPTCCNKALDEYNKPEEAKK